MPLGFLFAYCVIGLSTSIFLSPDKFISLYYGLAFLAPLLVLWTAFEKERTVDLIGSVMIVNEIVVYGVLFALLPEVIRVGTVYNRFSQIFNLPFGLGEMRANGVGRFAMTAIILAFIRLVTTRRKMYKLVWFAPIAAGLFILAQSRSRSSLLGLAVCSVLFVLIWGLDWRLILVGPMSAYVIWLSAIKWRLHGRVEGLMNLTGRDTTWQKGIEQLKESPFLGWGFPCRQADARLRAHAQFLPAFGHAGRHRRGRSSSPRPSSRPGSSSSRPGCSSVSRPSEGRSACSWPSRSCWSGS